MNMHLKLGMQVALKPKLAKQDIVLGKLMSVIFNKKSILYDTLNSLFKNKFSNFKTKDSNVF